MNTPSSTSSPFSMLITSVGSTGAQNVIKFLREQKEIPVYIIGVDANPWNSGRFMVDRYYTVPPVSREREYTASISRICSKERAEALLPQMDAELPVVSLLAEKMAPPTSVVVSSFETIRLCDDKGRMNAFLLQHKIPVPESYSSDTKVFPVILKPNSGSGSRNIHRIENRKEFDCVYRDGVLVQQYLKGEEYSIDCYSSMKGEFVGAVPRKRLETKGGLSTRSVTCREPAMIKMAERICRLLDLRGPSNIQGIKTREGFYIIEVNPRFGGAYLLSMKAGLKAPEYIMKEVRGIPYEYREFQPDLLMLRHWEETYIEEQHDHL